ncbi:MAG: cytochrome c3 family protein [Byssovorax sp.]
MKGRLFLGALALALTAGCAGILGIRPPDRRPFEHKAHVNKGINCVRCHAGIEMAGDEGPLHLPSPADCTSCHPSPDHGSYDGRPCGDCHGLAATRAGAVQARIDLRFEHRKHVSRLKGDCPRCHLDVGDGADVLRPRMANCGSCHNHQEQLAKRDCDACHVNLRDEGVQPDDHLIHAANFLREHGTRAAGDLQLCQSCHAERFCAGCHSKTAPALPERLRFDDPMHAGVHRAGFKSRHPEEARNDPGLCTTCHTPTGCKDCHDREHKSALMGAQRPHPPGWLGLPGQRNDHGRAAWRDPELCATCHGGAGEALCISCHKVGGVGGNPHAAGFNSRKRARIDQPCRACHNGG